MRKHSLYLGALFSLLLSCRGAALIEPPTFDYKLVTDRFFTENPGGHFPLTVQRGANLHPSATLKGQMFYTSDVSGSGDIWMRDLKNTINLPIIQHPAQQYHPAISPGGKLLAFVSDDLDSSGDIRIVNIDPDNVVRLALQGVTRQNYWDLSISVSKLIEQQAAVSLPETCRGQAAEDDPVFLADNKTLLFASDRCSPGQMNLWSVEILDDEIKNLKRLTMNGARQPYPSFDGQRIIFLDYRDPSLQGELYVRTADGKEQRLPLPAGKNFRTFSPLLSLDGKTAYYTAVRQDSNGDGQLDLSDQAGVYAMPVDATSPAAETVLLDDASVQGLGLCAWGGFLFYSANISGSINIYYLKPDGIIPRRPSIEAQFTLAQSYAKADVRRNFLALDAVKQYFLSAPETALYDGLIILEKWKRMARSHVADDLTKELKEQMRAAATGNRYAGLQFALDKTRSEGRPTSPVINSFLKELGTPSTDRDRLFQAGALEELAAALFAESRYAEALAVVTRLNDTYPNYHRAARARLLQASILLQTSESPGSVSDELLSKPDTAQAVKDELLTRIYDFYYTGRTAARALELVERELARPGVHREVAGTLRVVRARILYDRRKFTDALAEAKAATSGIPRESSVFVRGWQLTAFIHERLGNAADSYFARMEYGGAFRPDSGVSVTAKEYRELMDEGGRSADRALETARSIARAIDEAEDNTSGPLATPLVKVSGLDRDVLAEFCSTGSAASRMFPGLGPPNAQNYAAFCLQNAVLIKDRIKEPFSAEQAEAAVDLLYVFAYSNVNALNILFFYMKKVNLFSELHAEKSVHFHRLKVDTAIERNRRRLRKSRQKLTIPGARNVAELLVAEDPFDARAFAELEHGYKISSEPARQAGDLSLLYGYAYTLTQKSVEREQFYDEIRRSGTLIPEEAFKEKKENILKDMKTAEYQLRYILLVDPVNADAYLLMGWMYQYLDERKSMTVRREAGYVERFYNWVTKTRPAAPTEGRQYYSLYANYFPEQLFESNVELYRQALNLRSGIPDNAMETAHLNLNLGNNYFHLLNFKRAAEAYSEVDKATLGRGQQLFSSYRQEGLFRFNFARSLYYEGKNDQAAVQFEKAHLIYYSNEKKPLDEAAAALRYRRDQSKDADRQSVERHLADNARALKESRFRLALISALRGLVSLDDGRYDEGIAALDDARRQVAAISEGATDAGTENLDPAGVLNFLAMAHQGQRELNKSDERADEAAKAAQKMGLSRDDRRYQPQTIGGRMLGCLLTYGEDFAVVGEGRNPYGFSSARQYELSLGIRFENMILRGDYTKAAALLDDRRKTFLDQDGDLSFGKNGAVTAEGQKAYVLMQSKRYAEAAARYLDAAREARDYDLLDAFRLYFRNHFHAHFAALESKDASGEIDFKDPDGGLEDMEQFRAQYREKTIVRFTRERTAENPSFKYDEARDAPAVDRIVDYELTELIHIRGVLTLYKARRSLAMDKTFADYTATNELYTKAISDFDQAVSTYRARGDAVRLIRARINRARAYLESEKLLQAKAELESIVESAFEYGLVVEELEAQEALLSVLQRQSRLDGIQGEPPAGAAAVQRMLEILDRNPDLPGTLRNSYRFRETAASYLLGVGREAEALSVLEQAWNERLLSEYMRFPLSLTNADAASEHRRLRELLAKAAFLREEESRARLTHTGLEKVTAARDKAALELTEAGALFASKMPAHRAFVASLTGRPRTIPDLPRGGLLLRLYADDESVSVWLFSPAERRFYRRALSGTLEETVRSMMLEILPARTEKPSTLFLVADRRTFNLPLEQILSQVDALLPAPVFETRISGDHVGYIVDDRDVARAGDLNVFNADSFSGAFPDAYEADAALITAPALPSMFTLPGSAGNLDAREWISQPRSPSLVIAKSGTPSYSWNALLFEVMRASGAGTLAVDGGNDGHRTALLGARGLKRYTDSGVRIFGAPGFVRQNVRTSVIAAHNRLRTQAERLAGAESLSEAVRYHRLALSVLQGLPDASALGFENQLGMGAVLIAKTKGREGRTGLEEMIIQQLTAGNKGAAERIYRRLTDALASIGDIFKAEKTLNEYVKTFPEKKAIIQDELEMIRFLSKLRRPRYAMSGEVINFARDFERTLPLARQRGSAGLVTDLFRHGMHDEAVRAAVLFKAGGLTLPVTEYDIRADQALLWGRAVPRAAASDTPSQAGRFLTLSSAGDWAEYDRMLEAMRPEDNPALFAIKKKLFSLWRSYRFREAGAGFELQEGPSLVGLSLLERSMLFRILIDTSNRDAELMNPQILEALITAEVNSWSGERAQRMALAGALTYLSAGESGVAERFFRLALEAGSGTIPSADRTAASARAGLALIAAGRIDAGDKEAQWTKTLGDAGAGKSVRLFSLIKAKTLDRTALNDLTRAAFSSLRDGDTYPEDLQIAAAFWKDRALEGEDTTDALNAAFFEEEARNTAVQVRRGRGLPAGWRLPAALDTAESILSRLPKNQRFLALLDNGNKAVRLLAKDGKIQSDELDETGRRLRAKILVFMDQTRGAPTASANELGQWLMREYRAVFGGVDSMITYYWFPGVHGLFPMVPDRGDRLFQVLDPVSFAASAPVKTGVEFSPDFKLFASGGRALSSYSSRQPEDAAWALRLDAMETLSLGARSANPADPRHFLDAVLPLSTMRLDEWGRSLTGRSSSPWFVSGTLLSESTATEGEDYPCLVQYLGMRLSGPGILTIRIPGDAHAQFVRYFYNRGIPLSAMDRRFAEAYRALAASAAGLSQLYGYRLVTTSFLADN